VKLQGGDEEALAAWRMLCKTSEVNEGEGAKREGWRGEDKKWGEG
jgi:hypothetical protein